METLAWRANWRHSVLEKKIKEIDTQQDLSRSAITNRAILTALSVEDWTHVQQELLLLKRDDTVSPALMQAKVIDESSRKIAEIRSRILADLDEIKLVQTQYLVLLLWQNYLLSLEKGAIILRGKKQKQCMSAPELVGRIVHILMLQRECDAPLIETIHDLIKNWEE